MKLRNKKTGEIKEYTHTMTSYHVPIKGGYEIFTPWYPEEWEELEDVKEPLIKDEKIRKAVRAWAEANRYDKLWVYHDRTAIIFYNEDDGDNKIIFNTVEKFGLENLECYTITELCREEKQ